MGCGIGDLELASDSADWRSMFGHICLFFLSVHAGAEVSVLSLGMCVFVCLLAPRLRGTPSIGVPAYLCLPASTCLGLRTICLPLVHQIYYYGSAACLNKSEMHHRKRPVWNHDAGVTLRTYFKCFLAVCKL